MNPQATNTMNFLLGFRVEGAEAAKKLADAFALILKSTTAKGGQRGSFGKFVSGLNEAQKEVIETRAALTGSQQSFDNYVRAIKNVEAALQAAFPDFEKNEKIFLAITRAANKAAEAEAKVAAAARLAGATSIAKGEIKGLRVEQQGEQLLRNARLKETLKLEKEIIGIRTRLRTQNAKLAKSIGRISSKELELLTVRKQEKAVVARRIADQKKLNAEISKAIKVSGQRLALLKEVGEANRKFAKLTKTVKQNAQAMKVSGEVNKKLKTIFRNLKVEQDVLTRNFKEGLIGAREYRNGVQRLSKQLVQLQVRGLRGTTKQLRAYLNVVTKASAAQERLGGATQGVLRFFSRWRNRLLVLTFALAGLVRMVKRFISSAVGAEKQLIALSVISVKTGNTIDSVTAAAVKLSKDGVLGFVGASQAIKNLLSTGASLPIIVANLQAMKDAALANGLASLTAEEAIVRYTQGIKENKSQLTDTAGIMTNISVLLIRAKNNTDDLSVADKLLIEFTKEAGIFSGTLSKSLNTLGGMMQVAKTAANQLAIQFGRKLIPITKKLTERYIEQIARISEWISDEKNLNSILITVENTINSTIKVMVGLKDSFIAIAKPLQFVATAFQLIVSGFSALGETGTVVVRLFIELFVVQKIVVKVLELASAVKKLSLATAAAKIATGNLVSILITFVGLGLIELYSFWTDKTDKQRRATEKLKESSKGLKEVLSESILNIPAIDLSIQKFQELTKEMKEQENSINDLKASLLELTGFEREAFELRIRFKKIERQQEAQLRIDRLVAAKEREASLITGLSLQLIAFGEFDRTVKSLFPTLKQFNLRTKEGMESIIRFRTGLAQTSEPLAKFQVKLIDDLINNREQTVKLQNAIVKLKQSSMQYGTQVGILSKKIVDLDKEYGLLLDKFDLDAEDKKAKSIDRLAGSFENLRNKLLDTSSRFAATPLGLGATPFSFGAPRAAAAERSEQARKEIFDNDVLKKRQQLMDKINDLRNRDLITTKDGLAQIREVHLNANNLLADNENLSAERVKEIHKLAWEERIKLAIKMGRKLLNLTVFASIRQRTSLDAQSALAREKVNIELRKGLIDQTEATRQFQIIKAQGVIQEKAADKRRIANIQEAVAAELIARAVLWAILGPIKILEGNFLLGAAYLAGAAAAGVAAANLTRTSGTLRGEASVLDLQAGALADSNNEFDGQGRVISGSFSSPGGGFAASTNIQFNAGNGVQVFGQSIEDTTEMFKTSMKKAAQEGLDSGEVVVPVG